MNLADELEKRGFRPFLALGVSERMILKAVAEARIRRLNKETFEALLEGILQAVRRVYEAPLDDLERVSENRPTGLDEMELGE